jgi:hypothetical protein
MDQELNKVNEILNSFEGFVGVLKSDDEQSIPKHAVSFGLVNELNNNNYCAFFHDPKSNYMEYWDICCFRPSKRVKMFLRSVNKPILHCTKTNNVLKGTNCLYNCCFFILCRLSGMAFYEFLTAITENTDIKKTINEIYETIREK